MGAPPDVPDRSGGGTGGPGRDFLLLWTAAGAGGLAQRVAAIALPLLALVGTGSARAAGAVMFAALVPNLVVLLPAGPLVDRTDPRRLMVCCDAGCLIAGLTVAVPALTGRVWLGHLLVAAFVLGALGVVYQVAERSAVPRVVPDAGLAAALSRNEARVRAAGLLGPPTGTGLLAVAAALPFVFTTVAHLASLLLLLRISGDLRPQRREREPGTLAAQIGTGAAWVLRRPFLRTLVLLLAASNLVFQGLTLVLMTIVTERDGPVALVGLITALGGLGGLAGALAGRWWMRRLSRRALVVGGFAVWAAATALVAVATAPVPLAALYTVSGYVGGLLNVVGMVEVLRAAPDHLVGRVTSVVTLIGLGPAALGGPVAGGLLEAAGTAPTVLGMGAVMAVLALLAASSPAVRSMTGRERTGEKGDDGSDDTSSGGPGSGHRRAHRRGGAAAAGP